MEFVFGSGLLVATPLATTLNPNPAPRRFGVTQEVTLSDSFDTKELYGSNQYPVDARRGKGKITGTVKFAQINARQLNDIYHGGTVASGQKLFIDSEVHTVPAGGGAVQLNIPTGASAPTFDADKGVQYAASGQLLTQVAANPVQGQYTVAAGAYTFAAADANAVVLISYTENVTTGYTTQKQNQFMGTTPYFGAFLTRPANGIQSNVQIFKAMASKLDTSPKQDDYMIPSLDFMVLDPGTGILLAMYDAE